MFCNSGETDDRVSFLVCHSINISRWVFSIINSKCLKTLNGRDIFMISRVESHNNICLSRDLCHQLHLKYTVVSCILDDYLVARLGKSMIQWSFKLSFQYVFWIQNFADYEKDVTEGICSLNWWYVLQWKWDTLLLWFNNNSDIELINWIYFGDQFHMKLSICVIYEI